jgi:DNA polymerase III, delta subunit
MISSTSKNKNKNKVFFRPVLLVTRCPNDYKLTLDYLKSIEVDSNFLDFELNTKSDLDKIISDLYLDYAKKTCLYIGDLWELSIAVSQALLKLLEEPPQNLQIYLTSYTTESVLPTIISRIKIINLENKNILKIISPAQIERSNKLFGDTKTIINSLLNSTFTIDQLGDLSKVERYDLIFLCWQLTYSLELISKNLYYNRIYQLLASLTLVLNNLKSNLQKKISLTPLLLK